MSSTTVARRPIAARNARWARATAARLAQAGLRPNHVSLLSVVFAGMAALALVVGARSEGGWHVVLFLVAAACILLRLLCNMLDGMLAVEGGLRTKSGVIFNELPDRVSDSLIFACAGYATGSALGSDLGWAAALSAALTAYVRVLGGSAGLREDFSGPMAKQQRMAVLVAACLAGAAAPDWSSRALTAALALVVAGCAVTIARRTVHTVRELEGR